MQVISQPPSSTYTSQQGFFEMPTLSCDTSLSCPTSCVPVWNNGPCPTGACNITVIGIPGGGSCPRYGGAYTYIVQTGNNDTTINWDDGKPPTFLLGSPVDQPVAHTYSYPGSYNVVLDCGGDDACSKRYHVTCQTGGGAGPTPTNLPTATPTPTGIYPCVTPLICTHPCACGSTTSPYINGECSSGLNNSYKGLGAIAGTASGNACAPGLVCCQPPSSSSSDSWFKTKDASYHEKGPLSNSIPSNATSFGGTDVGLCVASDPSSLHHPFAWIYGIFSNLTKKSKLSSKSTTCIYRECF